MLGTLGIVQVTVPRCGRAAPGPAITSQRRFAGKPLLEWVVRRVTEAAQLDGVIALVGKAEAEAEPSSVQFVPSDIPVLVSQREDALGALAEAVSEFPCRGAVRVLIGNPFVDPNLIDRLVITARGNPGFHYISYCRSDGRPAVLSPLGFFAEWFCSDAIRRADKKAIHPVDRQQGTRFLYCHPELFQLRLIPIPDAIDRDDVRLTLDLEEDWDHAQEIYEALGPEALDWQRIAGLLDYQPRIRERMAVLNRADK
jgi:spore coat polysaccharide biosynthesis protein SpsF (cytidylyltransferase family)